MDAAETASKVPAVGFVVAHVGAEFLSPRAPSLASLFHPGR